MSIELSKIIHSLRVDSGIHLDGEQHILRHQEINYLDLTRNLREDTRQWAFGSTNACWITQLRNTPETTPDELYKLQQEHPPYGMFMQGPIVVENSGSTSNKRRLPFSMESWLKYITPASRGLLAYGVNRNDVIVTTDIGSTQAGYVTIEEAAKWIVGATVIPDRNPTLLRKIVTINDYKATVLVGNGPKLERLAASSLKINHPMKLVIVTGVPTDNVKQLEDFFQCPVTEYYGSSEMGHTYYRCPHGQRHLHIDYVIPHYTDKGTRFSNIASLPLFNYNLGDTLEYEQNGQCDCGSSLPNVIGLKTKDFCNIRKE